MKWQHSNRSRSDYLNAPAQIQKAFNKQVRLLAENLSHPSLRAKKYNESINLWQARVNRDWRFYFMVENNKYLIASSVDCGLRFVLREHMARFENAREAKEFLISRIAEQAQRDGEPLSEIERKELYFSESGWTVREARIHARKEAAEEV